MEGAGRGWLRTAGHDAAVEMTDGDCPEPRDLTACR